MMALRYLASLSDLYYHRDYPVDIIEELTHYFIWATGGTPPDRHHTLGYCRGLLISQLDKR